jgi:hypothetical protein
VFVGWTTLATWAGAAARSRAAALPDALAQHLSGHTTRTFDLVMNGAVRAAAIAFDAAPGAGGSVQWERLCAVANALQAELGLPAPAVSVSGEAGFRLWLSFDDGVPAPMAQRFVDQLCAIYSPETVPPRVEAPVALPPHLNPATGQWAAFIHPGMGSSFVDEPALEMAPPAAAQAAFLEGLHGIRADELRGALEKLAPAPVEQRAPSQPAPEGLLLKDATLEQIVRHLHGLGIEPTFRHVLRG